MCTYGPEHRLLYHLIRSLYLVNISMNDWCILWFSMEHDVKSFDIPPSPCLPPPPSYRQRVRVITRFPNIFSYCFCILSEFVKVFEWKV